jgi:hypothetical protein
LIVKDRTRITFTARVGIRTAGAISSRLFRDVITIETSAKVCLFVSWAPVDTALPTFQ